MSEKLPSPIDTSKLKSEPSINDRELWEIQQATIDDEDNFFIISPQENDSTGADTWKSYLDRKKCLLHGSHPEGVLTVTLQR